MYSRNPVVYALVALKFVFTNLFLFFLSQQRFYFLFDNENHDSHNSTQTQGTEAESTTSDQAQCCPINGKSSDLFICTFCICSISCKINDQGLHKDFCSLFLNTKKSRSTPCKIKRALPAGHMKLHNINMWVQTRRAEKQNQVELKIPKKVAKLENHRT